MKPTADYLDGVNVKRLQDALSFLGCAHGSHEEIAVSSMASSVNALTSAVLRSRDLLRAARGVGAPMLSEDRIADILREASERVGFVTLEAGKPTAFMVEICRAVERALFDGE